MASYLKPRRGTYSTASSKLTSSSAGVLKNGEIFFELNASGAGKGMGKIKMGDGSTNYSSLPYFLSLTDCGISFTANESTDQISSLVSGVTIPNAFRYIKSSLAYLKTQVTNLNNDLSYTTASNITIPQNSWVKVLNKSFTAGIYIFLARVLYPSNGAGQRYCYIGEGIGEVGLLSVSQPGNAYGDSIVENVMIYRLTTTTTINIYGFQNSGGSLTGCSGNLYYIKLK